ncbi:MAG: SsrA-binding protein SmpB [Actinobacteria bacterium]|nr:SsrA-binding protein SmpB [Actinomycetota bacterium]
MAKTKDPPGLKLIAQNRKARHDYAIEDTVEAGIQLVGTEVKALRDGKANLADAYATVRDGEIWLLQAHISPYSHGNKQNHDPTRPRKLLLHRQEIVRLGEKVARDGKTLVPLRLYFKHGLAKAEIGIATGKKSYDKRRATAKRDAERQMRRQLGRRR